MKTQRWPRPTRSRPHRHSGQGRKADDQRAVTDCGLGPGTVQGATGTGARSRPLWNPACQSDTEPSPPVCRYRVKKGARTFWAGPFLLCVLAGPGGCRRRPLGFEEHGLCVLGLTFKNGQAPNGLSLSKAALGTIPQTLGSAESEACLPRVFALLSFSCLCWRAVHASVCPCVPESCM